MCYDIHTTATKQNKPFIFVLLEKCRPLQQKSMQHKKFCHVLQFYCGFIFVLLQLC